METITSMLIDDQQVSDYNVTVGDNYVPTYEAKTTSLPQGLIDLFCIHTLIQAIKEM